MKAGRAFAAGLLLVLASLVPFAVAVAAEPELFYALKEAKAYGYKISVTKDAIEAARAQSNFYKECKARFNDPNCEKARPCDPATDAYQCETEKYNHTPNCPPSVALGLFKDGPRPVKPPGGTDKTGGAGDTAGRATADPHPANPIKVHELLTSGLSLTRIATSLQSGGMSSDTYIDLVGRENPEAHSETDGFIPNKPSYEERCWSGRNPPAPFGDGGPSAIDPADMVHVVSRSTQSPSTYHMTECFGSQCSQSETIFGRPNASHALMVSHLFETGGKVHGRLMAVVSGASFGGGQASADNIATYAAFESDGTAKGLKWSVVTVATGVKLGGQPVSPAIGGEAVGGPGGTFVGIAGPYVTAPADGSKITIIAPGFFYGTEQQTTYAAGAELRASMGRAVAQGTFSLPTAAGTTRLVIPGLIGFTLPEGAAPPPIAVEPPEQADPTVSIRELSGSILPAISIFSGAALALVLMLSGWVQRFGWGKRIFAAQPLRSLVWIYRAFVRT